MNEKQYECEGCKQKFNWWDLLWDIEDDREVCVTCYHLFHEKPDKLKEV